MAQYFRPLLYNEHSERRPVYEFTGRLISARLS